MNLFQKIAALFGAQYVIKVWNDSIYVRRARKIGKRWCIADTGVILEPQGVIRDHGAKWEPLTPKIERFYKAEVIRHENQNQRTE